MIGTSVVNQQNDSEQKFADPRNFFHQNDASYCDKQEMNSPSHSFTPTKNYNPLGDYFPSR